MVGFVPLGNVISNSKQRNNILPQCYLKGGAEGANFLIRYSLPFLLRSQAA